MERKDWKGQYKMVKLNEVCRASSSNIILKNIKEKTGDYPVYGASGYIQNIDSYHCNEPYIGIIKDGAGVGKVEIYPAYSSLLGTMQYIHASEKVDLRYIYYKLRSLDFTQYINGAAIPHIYFKDYGQEIIPVPPLPVQARIVDELDCLQGILSKKRQQLAEYHSLAQAIFHQMFGDPVVNEKGWEVKRLGEVCDSFNYGTSSAADENGKMKYLRMNNLTYEGEIILDNMKYINVDKESYEKYVVRRGDILFNRTNSKELVGKTALFNFDEEMIIAGYIIRIRVNNNTLHPQYATSYMNSPYMKAYLTTKAKGAVNQANISAKELKLFPIPLPPLPLQQSFAARIAAIDSQRERLAASIRELETLLACRMETLLNCPQA